MKNVQLQLVYNLFSTKICVHILRVGLRYGVRKVFFLPTLISLNRFFLIFRHFFQVFQLYNMCLFLL